MSPARLLSGDVKVETLLTRETTSLSHERDGDAKQYSKMFVDTIHRLKTGRLICSASTMLVQKDHVDSGRDDVEAQSH